jgi:hypothetical protein
VERYVRRGNPRATRDLSEGGAELYDRLISEGCAYVIEIADKLPRFQTNAFAELMSAPRTCPDRVRGCPGDGRDSGLGEGVGCGPFLCCDNRRSRHRPPARPATRARSRTEMITGVPVAGRMRQNRP